jgi:serine/threonine-protein kinase
MYMSPEQMTSSKAVDERTDLWTLGVTLYQMVSGRKPFEAEALPELCVQIMRDAPVPLHQVAPDTLPPGFEAVVMRCLMKDPGDRYQTVRELCRALVPYADSLIDATQTSFVLPKPAQRDNLETSGEISGLSQARLLAEGRQTLVPAVLVDDVPEDQKTQHAYRPTPQPSRAEAPTLTGVTNVVVEPTFLAQSPGAPDPAEDWEEDAEPTGFRPWKLVVVAAGIGVAVAVPVILWGLSGDDEPPPPPPTQTAVVVPVPPPTPVGDPAPAPAPVPAPAPTAAPPPPPEVTAVAAAPAEPPPVRKPPPRERRPERRKVAVKPRIAAAETPKPAPPPVEEPAAAPPKQDILKRRK